MLGVVATLVAGTLGVLYFWLRAKSINQPSSLVRQLEDEKESLSKQLDLTKQHNQQELKVLQQQLSDLEQQLKKLQADNQQLRDQLKHTQQSYEQNLKEKERQIQAYKQQIESYENDRSRQKNTTEEVSQLKAQISKLEDTLDDYQKQLEDEKSRVKSIKQTSELETHDTESVESKESVESQESDLSEESKESKESAESKKSSDSVEEDGIPPPYNPQTVEEDNGSSELPPSYVKPQETKPEETETIKPSVIDEPDLQDLEALKNQLDIPDDIMDIDLSALKKPAGQPEPEEEFDLSAFIKQPKKGGSSKKFDLKGLQKQLEGLDDFNPDELPTFDTKPSKSKKPAFMSVFQNEDEPSSSSPATALRTEPWKTGDPIIQSYGVKEDSNSKGMRRTKKRVGYGSTGKSHEMEDVSCTEYPFNGNPNKGLFCVFDGHGGRDCAASAIEKFPKEFSKQIDHKDSTDYTTEFVNSFLTVDEALLEYEYMGCTATSVFVWQTGGNRYVQAANVGDSTAFLKRGTDVVWLTRDHKASSAEEKERIRATGAELTSGQTRVSGGLAVSRALGDHFLKQEKVGLIAEPYVSPSYQLTKDDSIIILASDGLWDVMDGEEAMKTIEDLEDAEAMARRLIQKALGHPKCTDNITVIVLVL